uniref:Uncharacterized protein n=1 Tax=Glossina brevipalpis TaxID=37001 RepID=A0A1A9WCM1_9MUSC
MKVYLYFLCVMCLKTLPVQSGKLQEIMRNSVIDSSKIKKTQVKREAILDNGGGNYYHGPSYKYLPPGPAITSYDSYSGDVYESSISGNNFDYSNGYQGNAYASGDKLNGAHPGGYIYSGNNNGRGGHLGSHAYSGSNFGGHKSHTIFNSNDVRVLNSGAYYPKRLNSYVKSDYSSNHYASHPKANVINFATGVGRGHSNKVPSYASSTNSYGSPLASVGYSYSPRYHGQVQGTPSNEPSYAIGHKGLGHFGPLSTHKLQVLNTRIIEPVNKAEVSGSKVSFTPSTFLGTKYESNGFDYDRVPLDHHLSPAVTNNVRPYEYSGHSDVAEEHNYHSSGNNDLQSSYIDGSSAPSENYLPPHAKYDTSHQ